MTLVNKLKVKTVEIIKIRWCEDYKKKDFSLSTKQMYTSVILLIDLNKDVGTN